MARKFFLICGILASLLYIGINILVPMQWNSYSSLSQTVSELSAIGAPTRPLWLWVSAPYTFLMIAFAWGLLRSAGGNRFLLTTGKLMVAYGLLGLIWPFAPMHLRETLAAGGGTISDSIHIALGAVTEILYLVALGYAASALGKGFRIYSVATFVVLLCFGALTFMDAPNVSRNEPTPFIGLWERINIGVFLLWVIVLAVTLLRDRKEVSSKLAATGATASNIRQRHEQEESTR